MTEQPPPAAASDHPGPLRAKIVRYAAGSVLAGVCSEGVFLLAYGAFQAAPALASTIGWFAGALPNYWLNRTWTWRRRGRPSLIRELLPYVAIVLATLLIATTATSVVDAALADGRVSAGVRVVAVGGTFLGVYGGVFLLRFFLLDRLFRRVPDPTAAGSVGTVSAEESA